MPADRTRVFLGAEFTGLHQHTSLISIGLVTEKHDRTFYAELADFDVTQIDSWVRENVLCNLTLGDCWGGRREKGKDTEVRGGKETVGRELKKWLYPVNDKPESIEVWSDCLAYDWVLFCELFGGAGSLPENVYYIPFDLCTLLLLKGKDPDVDRERFAGMEKEKKKHHALWDAQVIRECYLKLNGTAP